MDEYEANRDEELKKLTNLESVKAAAEKRVHELQRQVSTKDEEHSKVDRKMEELEDEVKYYSQYCKDSQVVYFM